MFVTKRYHESEISRLIVLLATYTESHEALCESYENRISDLKQQIESLNKMVFPTNASREIPEDARELDAVIGASEKPIDVSEAEQTRMLEGAREMDLVMSGNYDMDLLQ